MTKNDLIIAVSEDLGIRKGMAEQAVTLVVDAITAALARGERAQIAGLGAFTTTKRKKRVVRIPTSGQDVIVPAQRLVKFKPAQVLRDAVNKKR